jgi:hypothetical protein
MLFVLYTIDDCNGHQITLGAFGKWPLTITIGANYLEGTAAGPAKIAQNSKQFQIFGISKRSCPVS